MTRADYVQKFHSEAQAEDFETSLLSMGRDCLPASAVQVLDGSPPNETYWEWLCGEADAYLATDVGQIAEFSTVDPACEWLQRVMDIILSNLGPDAYRSAMAALKRDHLSKCRRCSTYVVQLAARSRRVFPVRRAS